MDNIKHRYSLGHNGPFIKVALVSLVVLVLRCEPLFHKAIKIKTVTVEFHCQ